MNPRPAKNRAILEEAITQSLQRFNFGKFCCCCMKAETKQYQTYGSTSNREIRYHHCISTVAVGSHERLNPFFCCQLGGSFAICGGNPDDAALVVMANIWEGRVEADGQLFPPFPQNECFCCCSQPIANERLPPPTVLAPSMQPGCCITSHESINIRLKSTKQ